MSDLFLLEKEVVYQLEQRMFYEATWSPFAPTRRVSMLMDNGMWLDKQGNNHKLSDMSVNYLQNSVKYVTRQCLYNPEVRIHEKENWAYEVYSLVQEIHSRKRAVEHRDAFEVIQHIPVYVYHAKNMMHDDLEMLEE